MQNYFNLQFKSSVFEVLMEHDALDNMQSYWEITSDPYLDYIKNYVVGIGPWKDTVVPVVNNYSQTPTDLVARAHAHDLQVNFICLKLLFTWRFILHNLSCLK